MRKRLDIFGQNIFKLPVYKLAATSFITHYLPTPSIPASGELTLRNCRIPGHHQKVVEIQIQKVLEDDIIQPCQSPWKFSILIVPKKLDASGKRKWRICVYVRRLNDLTIDDNFPLSNIQDILY